MENIVRWQLLRRETRVTHRIFLRRICPTFPKLPYLCGLFEWTDDEKILATLRDLVYGHERLCSEKGFFL